MAMKREDGQLKVDAKWPMESQNEVLSCRMKDEIVGADHLISKSIIGLPICL